MSTDIDATTRRAETTRRRRTRRPRGRGARGRRPVPPASSPPRPTTPCSGGPSCCSWSTGAASRAGSPVDLHGDATMISGASGVGKSTVLDAYTALMMPSDTKFNGASNDAVAGRARGAGQRNLLSYLRGAVDVVDDPRTGRPVEQLLRGQRSDTWGAVAMTFVNDQQRRFTALRTYYVPRRATRSGEVQMQLATLDAPVDLGEPRGRRPRPLPRQHAEEALPRRPGAPHVRRVRRDPLRPAGHRGQRRRREGAAAAGPDPGAATRCAASTSSTRRWCSSGRPPSPPPTARSSTSTTSSRPTRRCGPRSRSRSCWRRSPSCTSARVAALARTEELDSFGVTATGTPRSGTGCCAPTPGCSAPRWRPTARSGSGWPTSSRPAAAPSACSTPTSRRPRRSTGRPAERAWSGSPATSSGSGWSARSGSAAATCSWTGWPRCWTSGPGPDGPRGRRWTPGRRSPRWWPGRSAGSPSSPREAAGAGCRARRRHGLALPAAGPAHRARGRAAVAGGTGRAGPRAPARPAQRGRPRERAVAGGAALRRGAHRRGARGVPLAAGDRDGAGRERAGHARAARPARRLLGRDRLGAAARPALLRGSRARPRRPDDAGRDTVAGKLLFQDSPFRGWVQRAPGRALAQRALRRVRGRARRRRLPRHPGGTDAVGPPRVARPRRPALHHRLQQRRRGRRDRARSSRRSRRRSPVWTVASSRWRPPRGCSSCAGRRTTRSAATGTTTSTWRPATAGSRTSSGVATRSSAPTTG